MDSHHFLETALVFLVATVIAVPLTKRFKLGSVLGYLIAGIVIGPQELGLVNDTAGVATISEFGVVLMIGGNIPGKTKVLSVAIYDYVETMEWTTAHLLSAGMVAFSFVVILAMMLIEKRHARRLRQ